MIRASLLAAVAALALTRPALALVEPKPGPHDPRMRTAEYVEGEVYRLIATRLSTVQIILPTEQKAVGYTSGDSLAWEIIPGDPGRDSNIVVVKAKEVRPVPTTIQIVARTDEGELRTYLFEASARDGSIAATDPQVMLSIRFRDRERELKEAREKAAARRAAAALRQAEARLEVAHYYGTRNWRYSATQGPLRAGLEVSDNRISTVFRFAGNVPIPAIYMIGPDSEEQRVQTIVRGEEVVVPMTAPLWRLRLGSEVLDVRNDDYDPIGVNLGTGTSTPDVTREPRHPLRRVSR